MGQFIKKFKDTPERSANDQIEATMDPYHEMFQKCAAEINKFYTPDLHYFIRDHLPGLYQSITETEKKIDQLWGIEPLAEFRKELIIFYKLHEKAYRQFSGSKA